MAIYVYRSTDTSAPTLNGVAGSLINVLDACLVNGYGDKTSLGQTKEYNGTNIATYRMPVGTSRMYMAVDDTATTAARWRGFEDVTAAGINPIIGTNPFPNDYQMSGGLYFLKSSAANATPIGWVMFSDSTIFYFWVDTQVSGQGSASGKTHAFGDIVSFNPLYDNYACLAIGQSLNANNEFLATYDHGTKIPSHYMPRRYDGFGGSVGIYKQPLLSYQTVQIMGNTGGNYLISSDPLVGGMIVTPILILETYIANQGILRGMLPGVQSFCNSMVSTYNNGDIINPTRGDLAGKSFQQYKGCTYFPSGQAVGSCLFEISDTQRNTSFF